MPSSVKFTLDGEMPLTGLCWAVETLLCAQPRRRQTGKKLLDTEEVRPGEEKSWLGGCLIPLAC